MASKTISVKEETYQRLVRAKGDDESFSDVIDRMLHDRDEHPLFDLVGLLDDEDVRTLRRRSTAFRENLNSRIRNETDDS